MMVPVSLEDQLMLGTLELSVWIAGVFGGIGLLSFFAAIFGSVRSRRDFRKSQQRLDELFCEFKRPGNFASSRGLTTKNVGVKNLAVEQAKNRTDQKLRYAEIHLEELENYDNVFGNDEWERAHEESCLAQIHSAAGRTYVHKIITFGMQTEANL